MKHRPRHRVGVYSTSVIRQTPTFAGSVNRTVYAPFPCQTVSASAISPVKVFQISGTDADGTVTVSVSGPSPKLTNRYSRLSYLR